MILIKIVGEIIVKKINICSRSLGTGVTKILTNSILSTALAIQRVVALMI